MTDSAAGRRAPGQEPDRGEPAARRPRLILASASPRRRELLGGLGLRFEVRPAECDETPLPGETPAAMVLRLAREKACRVASELDGEPPGALVLAADTTVVLDGEILGKPLDEDDARRMLARLAGRQHEVLTGLALHQREGGATATALERSRVRMAALGAEEIAWYVASGEPLDKAGSYAVQGLGALFVEAVEGNYTNVVGLPLPAVRRLFGELGYDLRAFVAGR
jgi:septum formation protein